MLQLIAENAGLRTLLLVLLFTLVVMATYFSTRAFGMRQVVRGRLADGDTGLRGTATSVATLRSDRVQTSWSKLVDAI